MDEQEVMTKEQLDYAWNCKALISFIGSCFLFAVVFAVMQNFMFDIFAALIGGACCFVFSKLIFKFDNRVFKEKKNITTIQNRKSDFSKKKIEAKKSKADFWNLDESFTYSNPTSPYSSRKNFE